MPVRCALGISCVQWPQGSAEIALDVLVNGGGIKVEMGLSVGTRGTVYVAPRWMGHRAPHRYTHLMSP